MVSHLPNGQVSYEYDEQIGWEDEMFGENDDDYWLNFENQFI